VRQFCIFLAKSFLCQDTFRHIRNQSEHLYHTTILQRRAFYPLIDPAYVPVVPQQSIFRVVRPTAVQFQFEFLIDGLVVRMHKIAICCRSFQKFRNMVACKLLDHRRQIGVLKQTSVVDNGIPDTVVDGLQHALQLIG
jgi:hypothetical protein